MGNIVNKYQKYCGTCAFWDGKVVAKILLRLKLIAQMQSVLKRINILIIK